jgi:hypothetical protein
MRRLEVERIDGVPAATPAGLGPEMRPWGLKFPPANPVDDFGP